MCVRERLRFYLDRKRRAGNGISVIHEMYMSDAWETMLGRPLGAHLQVF